MYVFALMIASLMGFVCAEGVYMATLGSKWKTALGFVMFTAICFACIIS